ncbi:MAG: ABC transporter permease [Bacteriovoracaceae bacterium]
MTNFSYLFKFALRNITRNKARSFFIGFSVAISVTMAVWIMALFDGMNKQIIGSIIDGNVGHFQVQEKNWGMAGDPTKPISPNSDLRAKLLAIPGVQGVSQELILEGFVNSTHGAQSVNLIGVVPEQMDSVVPIQKNLVEGMALQNDSKGALIGLALKEKFHLKLGDQIVLNYQDVVGNLRNELVPVTGIFNANAPSFQKGTIYMTGTEVGKLLGETPDKPLQGSHRFVILAPDIEGKVTFAPILNDNIILKAWADINPEMGGVVQFHHGLVNFFLVIVGICISVTILTPISMLWQERVKEFEMMHTIGINRYKMWLIGFSEAVIMFLYSLGLALFLIFVIVGTQSKTGLNFAALYDDVGSVERAGIVLPRVVYPILTLGQFVVSISFVMFTVFISYALAIRSGLKQIRFT